MTRKEYLEAIIEICDDAPDPFEERTLTGHEKILADYNERFDRIYHYANDLLKGKEAADGDIVLPKAS